MCHYVLALMLMGGQGKFQSPQNIYRVSQQSNINQLTSWSRWGLVLNINKQLKKETLNCFMCIQSDPSQTDLKRCYLHPFWNWNLHCGCWARTVSVDHDHPTFHHHGVENDLIFHFLVNWSFKTALHVGTTKYSWKNGGDESKSTKLFSVNCLLYTVIHTYTLTRCFKKSALWCQSWILQLFICFFPYNHAFKRLLMDCSLVNS